METAGKNYFAMAANVLKNAGRLALDTALNSDVKDAVKDVAKIALGGIVGGAAVGATYVLLEKLDAYLKAKAEDKQKIAKELNSASKELEELRAAVARGEFQPNQPHKYMSAVIYVVKDGDSVSDAEQERLANAMCGGDEGTKRTQSFIADMTEKVGIEDLEDMTVNADGAICYTGNVYFSLNFDQDNDIAYDEEYAKELMGVLNEIVGRDVFSECLLYGRNWSMWGE